MLSASAQTTWRLAPMLRRKNWLGPLIFFFIIAAIVAAWIWLVSGMVSL